MHHAHKIPLVALSLCGFALGPSCKTASPANPPDTGAPATGQANTERDAGSETESGSAPQCRAVVNGEGYFVHLSIYKDGRPAEVEFGEGNVVFAGDKSFGLREVTRGEGMQAASIEVEALPGGEVHPIGTYAGYATSPEDILDACIPKLEQDDPDGPQGECYEGHYLNDELSVTSTLGPFISVSGSAYGYTGGAHGVDEVEMSQWNLSTATPQRVGALELLSAAQRALLEQTMGEEGYGDDADEYDEGTVPVMDDVNGISFAVTDEGDLRADVNVGCCTWNENHGHFEFELPLENPPKPVRKFVPDPDTHRWEQPGCGSVDLAGTLRDAAGKELTTLDFESPPLGVYWLDATHPFKMTWVDEREAQRSMLYEGETPKLNGESPATLARRMMKQKRYAAAANLFEQAEAKDNDGRWLGELGWAVFHVGDLERAQDLMAAAMRGATSKPQLGALMYNLGRIAEADKDIDLARSRYEASLALRPNATVRKRLAGLPPNGG